MDATTLTQYVNEIEARGGETAIFTTPYGKGRSRGYDIPLAVADEQEGLALLRCEGWRFYSRKYGVRKATLAYLAGRDDNGPWAVRVPGTVESVAEALKWHTPPEVHRARAEGREVRRQGDVWVVALSPRSRDRAASGEGLPSTHAVVTDTQGRRRLVHTPREGERHHRAIYLPRGPVGFYAGRRVDTRRGGARD